MSENSRAVWEPRLLAISQAWQRAEILSVVSGSRPASYLDVPAHTYVANLQELSNLGLAVLVADLRSEQQGYSAQSAPVVPGAPVTTRLAVARDLQMAIALVGATRAGDNGTIGALLGYPECCRESFCEWWGEQTEPPTEGSDNYISAANLFLRWIGVRAVPHLPCRMDCTHTGALAAIMAQSIPEPERSWLANALKWPTLYTARNEIAFVETPVVRIVGEADPGTRRIELPGSAWPIEGAIGVEFPLRPPEGCRPRAVEEPMAPEHEINGFDSLQAMLQAHEMVVDKLPAKPEDIDRVVDLGCGSGRLASLIAGRLGIIAAGCDVSPAAVGWAQRAYPDGAWWEGEAEDYSPSPGDLILTTPKRLPSSADAAAAMWLYQYRGEGGFAGGPEPAKVEVA